MGCGMLLAGNVAAGLADIEVLPNRPGPLRPSGVSGRTCRRGNKLIRRAIAYGIEGGSVTSSARSTRTCDPSKACVSFGPSPVLTGRIGAATAIGGPRRGNRRACTRALAMRLSLTFVTTAGTRTFLSLVQEQLRRSGVEVVPRSTALLEKTSERRVRCHALRVFQRPLIRLERSGASVAVGPRTSPVTPS